MNNFFYGWYFRCQGTDGTAAVIPAVHLSPEKRCCSIQVITEKGSLFKEFPISQFKINRKKGIMQIGDNIFSQKGIRMCLETETTEGTNILVRGNLTFGEFKKLDYDIMGPFAYIPDMQCNHAIYSMRHIVNGMLRVGQERLTFHNALGYMEGDSGCSFPEKYIWTQHFIEGGSLSLAVATIPFGPIHFTGTIGVILRGDKQFRLATYLGARVRKLRNREVEIQQGAYKLYVWFGEAEGNALKAPVSGKMSRQIKENVASVAGYKLMYRGKTVLCEGTNKAATEWCYIRG